MEVIRDKIKEVQKIGGIGVRVQVDETAICNGLVVVNPSSEPDVLSGAQWIVGGVMEGCSKSLFELVSDRRSWVIEELFKKYIFLGSIILLIASHHTRMFLVSLSLYMML